MNDSAKKSPKTRRKFSKSQKAASLLPNLPDTSDFVGETAMILDQPISQVRHRLLLFTTATYCPIAFQLVPLVLSYVNTLLLLLLISLQ